MRDKPPSTIFAIPLFMKDFIKVGTGAGGYPEIRNIFSLPFKKVKVVRRYDLMNIKNFIYFKLYHKSKNEYIFLHRDFGLNDVDLFHFFNKISFSNTPWITTFETRVPYFKPSKTLDSDYKPLLSRHCKKLIAISQRAYNIETYLLDQRKQFKNAVIEKMTVIHPPQIKLLDDYSEKHIDNNSIIFTLVGRRFFLKGGMEVLKVFDRLFQTNKNIKLNLVSLLEHGDYISKSTVNDVSEAQKIIDKYPGKISYYKSLDNNQVLELYKNSHVSLQPSYHESYGYSILEAQACGCPVISTDVCAMPEINNEACGWLLNIPQDELKDGIWRTEEERKKLSDTLQEQLHSTIIDILNNPGIIKQRGINSLKRIATEHSPEDRAEMIEKIYRESLVIGH